MPQGISGIKKKRGRGRPPVHSTAVMVRIPPEELAALDAWIAKANPKPSRPVAIRELVRDALGGKQVRLPGRKGW